MRRPVHAARRRVTVAARAVIVSVLGGVVGGIVFVAALAAQGPPGLPPEIAAMFQERTFVARFDENGDGWLNAAERRAARAAIARQAAENAAVLGRFGLPPDGLAGLAAGRGGPTPSPGRRLTPADVRPAGDAPLYDPATLRTIFIQFENTDWEQELADFYNSDVDVPATVTVDGAVYRDVGIRFRGASSFLFVPPGLKRSLNVSIDFVHDDQRLLGYRTLNLLNANSDPTFVRAMLYAEAARHYLPAPKMNYVRVVINGESWGIYVSAQQFNTDFVNEHFGTRRGARWRVPGSPWGQGGMRYLGDDPAAYRSIYSIRSRDEAQSWAQLIRLFRVLTETPIDSLEAALDPLLDIDGALKFLALEVAFVNSDGYWVRASDYNLYLDERGRFHIVPHDVNEAFAEEGLGLPPGAPPGPPPGLPPGPPPGGAPPAPPFDVQMPALLGQANASLDPLVGMDDPSKPLRSRLLAVPALRARYLGYVREIAERWLDWNTLEPLVTQYQGLIAEEVRADTRKLYPYERFVSDVAASEESVKHFVDRRRAFLLNWTAPRVR